MLDISFGDTLEEEGEIIFAKSPQIKLLSKLEEIS